MKNIQSFDKFNEAQFILEAKKAKKEKEEKKEKKEEGGSKGLTAKQKKLPEGLRKAIMKRKGK